MTRPLHVGVLVQLVAVGLIGAVATRSEAALCRRKNGAVAVRSACTGKLTPVTAGDLGTLSVKGDPGAPGDPGPPGISKAFSRYINTPQVTVDSGSQITVGAMTLPDGSYVAIVRVEFSNSGADAAEVGCYLTNGQSNFGDTTNSSVAANEVITQ